MSELYQFKPPFSIYFDGVEIGDEDGHICTAENPDIAEAISVALNSHADLMAALEDIAATKDNGPDWSMARKCQRIAAAALAKAKGGQNASS